MNKVLQKILIPISIFFFIVLAPISIFAQGSGGSNSGTGSSGGPAQYEDEGLVPCGNEKIEAGQPGEYGIANPCKWDHVLELVDRVVRFILFALLVPIAAIMVAYAGFLMLFSGGSPDKRSKAKNILLNVVIGMFFAIGAWIIIHTLLDILGYEGNWIGF